MNRLIVLAVLVLNGANYWTPCERGAIFCPHFNNWGTENIEGQVKVNVNDGDDDEDEDINVVYVDRSDAPSMVIVGVDE